MVRASLQVSMRAVARLIAMSCSLAILFGSVNMISEQAVSAGTCVHGNPNAGGHCYGRGEWDGSVPGTSTTIQLQPLTSATDGSRINNEEWLINNTTCGASLCWVEGGTTSSNGSATYYFTENQVPNLPYRLNFLDPVSSSDFNFYVTVQLSQDVNNPNLYWACLYTRYGIACQALNRQSRAFPSLSRALSRLTLLRVVECAAAHTPGRNLPHCVRPPRQCGAACAPPHSALPSVACPQHASAHRTS